jgi:hypothetical protein
LDRLFQKNDRKQAHYITTHRKAQGKNGKID